MYKKPTSSKSSEKPKFNREKSTFSKDKPKFSREKSKFSQEEKPKFNREKKSFGTKSYKKFSDDAGVDFQSVPDKKNRKGTDYKSAPARGLRSKSAMTDFQERKARTTSPRQQGKSTFSKDKPKFSGERTKFSQEEKPKFSREKKSFGAKPVKRTVQKKSGEEGIRLNKYIANAGICSRREADTLIESGVIRINGVICTQLGTRVMPDDKVEFGGETLTSQKKVYLLMNKPKDYITTTDDPQERKTVMELIKGTCKERIYPVGRLDRQTTGVLLFTNDGEMAKKLTHPSHGARKIYHVTLDKNITKADLQSISKGVELEDGFVHVDEINLIMDTKNEVGIQLHSGMNRVVRRIFDKFDYKVVKLDRVLFAELTKKDLPRGRYRMLTDKEISFLKMK